MVAFSPPVFKNLLCPSEPSCYQGDKILLGWKIPWFLFFWIVFYNQVSSDSPNYSSSPENRKSNISCKKISSEIAGQGNSSTRPSPSKVSFDIYCFTSTFPWTIYFSLCKCAFNLLFLSYFCNATQQSQCAEKSCTFPLRDSIRWTWEFLLFTTLGCFPLIIRLKFLLRSSCHDWKFSGIIFSYM